MYIKPKYNFYGNKNPGVNKSQMAIISPRGAFKKSFYFSRSKLNTLNALSLNSELKVIYWYAFNK